MEEKLIEILSHYTSADVLGVDAETEILSDELGLTSIALMQIAGEVEDEFDIEISDVELSQIKTVGDFLEILEAEV